MGATSKDLHIDSLLSEFGMGYRPQGFIADMIFPIAEVDKESDIYPVFDRATRTRLQNTVRARGVRAKQIVENVGSGTYFCKNYALASPVFIEDKANADPVFQSLNAEDKVSLVIDGLYLDWDRRVANLVTSGSNVGSFSAVASAWTDRTSGNSDPLGDVFAGIDNVYYSNGVRVNKVTFGPRAWDDFRRHDDVRNLIFGVNNGGGYPSLEQVKTLLEVDEVLIGGSFQSNEEEGIADLNGTLSSVWGDSVLLSYTPTAPTIQRPSFGYSIRWVGEGLPNLQVERHAYDSRTKSEEVEVGYYQDEVITGASYAFLLTNASSN